MPVEKVELIVDALFSLCLEYTRENYLLTNMQIIDLKSN